MIYFSLPIDILPFISPVLPRNTNKPDNETEEIPRKWYTMVWTGKYNGSYDKRGLGTGLHTGVDIAVTQGTEVKSIADGKVVCASNSGGWGNLVTVKHEINNTTIVYSHYAHLKEINVSNNAKIKMGTILGKVGSTGTSSGPHLHFQIDKQSSPYWISGYKNNNEKIISDSKIEQVRTNTYDPIKFILEHRRLFCLPISENNDLDITREYCHSLYANSEQTLNYYPITSYGWWHNGVHLSGNRNDEIHAIANGKIIYVCIGREPDAEYGNSNFVVLEHNMIIDDKHITFYSMYMHLQKIEIEKYLDETKRLPYWITKKFYYDEKRIDTGMKGTVKKTYTNTDGSKNSLTLYEKANTNSNRIEELYKGDRVEIVETPKGNFVKVKTFKKNVGYLYYEKNSISCKRLHHWAIDDKSQINYSIFNRPKHFNDPIEVYAGEVIGYLGEGLEHIEIVNHLTTIKKRRPLLHLEIFSRTKHNNGTDIYFFLNAKPDYYFFIEDKDDDVIAEPVKEKMKILEELKNTEPNFVNYLNKHFPEAFQTKKNRFLFWETTVLKDKEVQNYMNEFKEQFRDCVSKHISTWQAIGNKISYNNSNTNDSLKGLEDFKLFKSKTILDNNEKLFYYHPIKFIEKLHSLTNNVSELHASESTILIIKEDTDCIKRLKKKGIVNNNDFNPDDPVKRAEFLKMLLVSLEYSIPPHNTISVNFTDVDKNAWFAPYIYLADLCRIAQGYRTAEGKHTGRFGPIDNTTIDQALKMLSVAKYGTADAKKDNYNINGKTSGTDDVTREQAAGLICNILDDNVTESHIQKRQDALVRRITGPDKAEIGNKLFYRVVKYANNPAKIQKDSINWIIKDEHSGKTIESLNKIGERLEYTPNMNLCQKTIRVTAYTDKITLEASILTEIAKLRFFIKESDEKKYISYIDISNKDHFGTKIYAEKNGKSELFAQITRYKSRYGLTTIYNNKGRPRLSVKDFSDSKHKVGVAVSNNEGSFVDTQSYDSGILSHGTIQWTMSSGNLQSLLNDYKKKAPDMFNKYFIYQGIDTIDNSIYVDGQNLNKNTVSLKLAYWLWKSGYENKFQKLQIEKMISRLASCYPDHRGFKNIAKYFTSENAVAHLFDLNVNRPAYVSGVAQEAVNQFNKDFPNKKNPDNWSDADEKEFIERFLEIRINYGKTPMTDSASRASNINNISSLSTKRNSYND